MAIDKNRLKYYKEYDYPKHAYTFFHNKYTKVHLLNGKTFNGYLIKEYTYEILLIVDRKSKGSEEVDVEGRIMIPKHSICYAENNIKV
ncbi:TPA: hypothetical protein PBT65_001732 [Staphylococcus aureus]|nr:hypothetical protein [Staphylococcus aureus]